jgi:hypothetical protein
MGSGLCARLLRNGAASLCYIEEPFTASTAEVLDHGGGSRLPHRRDVTLKLAEGEVCPDYKNRLKSGHQQSNDLNRYYRV